MTIQSKSTNILEDTTKSILSLRREGLMIGKKIYFLLLKLGANKHFNDFILWYFKSKTFAAFFYTMGRSTVRIQEVNLLNVLFLIIEISVRWSWKSYIYSLVLVLSGRYITPASDSGTRLRRRRKIPHMGNTNSLDQCG